jgi:anhydro-N-acetylmuramic acid kinase
MATLCEFTATCIANSIVGITQGLSNIAIYASGGGIHNPLLMSVIEQKIKMAGVSSTLNTTQDLALNPDAKEAVLFAILANETLCRDDDNFAMKSTPQAHITMGKVSFPD